jgi:molybdenum cofactor cytidylyltransferase
MTGKLGILVLAAGLSTRMEGPNKLLLPWRGQPVLSHVLSLAGATQWERKALVYNSDGEAVQALLPEAEGWLCIENKDAQAGLSLSLRLGLAALTDCQWVLVLLGDMPDVLPQTVKAMIAARHDYDYAIAPINQGDWGNPVLLNAEAIRDCASLEGDLGARTLLRANRDRVRFVEVQDAGIFRDFDVIEDFDVSGTA